MLAHLALSLAFSAPLDDPVLTLGGKQYRAQSLSPSLLRVERKGVHFEDRNTFLVANRPSVTRPFQSVDSNATFARLTTTESLVLTLQATAPTPSCAAPIAAHDASSPQRIADKPARKLASQSKCCAACDEEKTCVAWIWAPGSAEAADDPPGSQ